MDFQTEIKVAYEVLTQTQKNEICNGCGGKGSWLKPPLKAFYKTSCNHHDYGYWCGSTEEQRKFNDIKLFQNMKKDCSRLPWWKFLLYYPWCRAYYTMVRRFGKDFFYYGITKRWPIPTQEQLKKLKEKKEC